MRRGHPSKGSAVEGCREHSLIKQAYSSAEPCQPAHHGRPLDRRHAAASDGKLDRQGSQHHVDNIVQEERNGDRNRGGMVQSCENTQAHKDENGDLPRVVLGKEGGEIEEPDQQAASGGEKGFASTRQPTTDRGRVGLLREIGSLLRHTRWTFLSWSLETIRSAMGCRGDQLADFQRFDTRWGDCLGDGALAHSTKKATSTSVLIDVEPRSNSMTCCESLRLGYSHRGRDP